jgi:hypothetical protein
MWFAHTRSMLMPRYNSAPVPFAHQWSELIPQAMNSAAKRFGKGPGTEPAAGVSPQAGSDSN